MASIRRHPEALHRWQVRYRDPSGRQRTKNFAKKSDAEKHAAIVEADKVRGQWSDPQLARTSFGSWWTQYCGSKVHLSASTRARTESLGRNMILPTFGTVELGSIQPVLIRRWISELMERRYAPATVHKAYQLFGAAIRAAVEEGLIVRSPLRGISLPRQAQTAMRFLTAEEVSLLAEAIDPRYRALVFTAAYSGLRLGELTGLRVTDIDFLRRKLHVDQTLTEVSGELRFKEPKTRGSRRTVNLPKAVIGILAEHIAAYPSTSGLVFTAIQGGPIRQTNFRRRHWQPAVRASIGGQCRFHDLRHTHAALMISQGEHPKVIQSRLGHASISTTLDTYGHLFEGLDEAAADRLNAVFEGVRVDNMWTEAGA